MGCLPARRSQTAARTGTRPAPLQQRDGLPTLRAWRGRAGQSCPLQPTPLHCPPPARGPRLNVVRTVLLRRRGEEASSVTHLPKPGQVGLAGRGWAHWPALIGRDATRDRDPHYGMTQGGRRGRTTPVAPAAPPRRPLRATTSHLPSSLTYVTAGRVAYELRGLWGPRRTPPSHSASSSVARVSQWVTGK